MESYLQLPSFPLPWTSLLGTRQDGAHAGAIGCSQLRPGARREHGKGHVRGAGRAGPARGAARVCSRPGAVADGHVVFRLHQPEAVAAEVELGGLRIRVDQLQVKACEHEEHEPAERRCGGCAGAGARARAGPGSTARASSGLPPRLSKAHERPHTWPPLPLGGPWSGSR